MLFERAYISGGRILKDATGLFWLLLLFHLMLVHLAPSAQPLNDRIGKDHQLKEFLGKKISNSFPDLLNSRQDSMISLIVWVSDSSLFLQKYPRLIRSSYPDYNCYAIEIRSAELRTFLLDRLVAFAQPSRRQPIPETSVPGFDHSVSSSSLAWQRYPDATGQNIVVSIKENRFDTADIDFRKRYFLNSYSAAQVDIHATYMASMIAGAGNSSRYGKGLAWKSGVTSTNFNTLMPESIAYYLQNGISIQNHSYGVGVEVDYGVDAAAYDESMWKDSTLIHVFSAGNAGLETPLAGRYAGLKGWANLTGSFKMSKNSLAIAAVDSFYQPELRSSRGPANDGRIKPELAAYGEDGTSGAAALVSGTMALLQQKGRDLLSGSMPSSALAKALLVCGSDDAGEDGPDFVTGYGILNTARSLQILAEKKFVCNALSTGQLHSFEIVVLADQRKFSIALAWTDTAAHPAAATALVNDLDLQVVAPDGTIIHPWILSSFPATDSLRSLPVRGIDSLNVVELITWKNPSPGRYRIQVNAKRVKTNTQSFALAWHTISADSLEFTNPLKTQNADASEGTVIRWNHSFPAGTLGSLVWKNLTTGEEIVLQENVQLDKRYYLWKPKLSGVSSNQLRLSVNGKSFNSDTFLLHQRVVPKVGYICDDSLLLYWPKTQGASAYQVYSLKDSFLHPFNRVIDTSIIINRKELNTPWLAVAPILDNQMGGYGNSFNYNLQGTGCYVSTFLADLDGDLTRLTLQLGTSFGISKISFQKKVQGQFKEISAVDLLGSMKYSYNDSNLISGANTYRAAIFLQNGQVVFSQPETVFYTGTDPFILFPNPASVPAPVHFVTRNADIFSIRISNISGKIIGVKPINNLQTPIDLSKMQRGVYIIQALGETGEIISSKKLVIL